MILLRFRYSSQAPLSSQSFVFYGKDTRGGLECETIFPRIVQSEELQVGTHCAKQVTEEVRLLNLSRRVPAIDESFRNCLKAMYKDGPI